MTHEEFVDSLRQIADFYEQHPNCPLPSLGERLHIFPDGIKGLAAVAREFGDCTKSVDEGELSFYRVRRQFGALALEALDYRHKVCKRIVTGSHEERVKIPLTFEEHIRMVEDVRWECPDSLLEESNQKEEANGNS